MNTQKHKYFEFSESTNAPYGALINADNADRAIEIYKEDVTSDDVGNISCIELSSSKAWEKLIKSEFYYHSIGIEDDIDCFDREGVLMIDCDLAG
ncbi:hypothetical protein [Lactiplantibacillus plantarum]|uniref:hypothetical protein n=1 Tax=Lactiplantibacillus plantarum TaxID=1590 RepID=UPI00345AF55F